MSLRRAMARTAWIGLTALAANLAAPAPAQAQASFALSCRGGGEMVARLAPLGERGSTRLTLFFVRAPQGASQQLPAAGQCAWLDRGFGVDEPVRMIADFRNVVTTVDLQADEQLRGYDFAGSDRVAQERLRSLLDAVFAGEPFTVHVRTVGRGDDGYLEVTRVGP